MLRFHGGLYELDGDEIGTRVREMIRPEQLMKVESFLGVDLFLEAMSAAAVVMMSVALVGLATGMGARYPRFGADPAEVSGSFGGVAFMTQAVLFVIVMIALVGWPSSVYAFRRLQGRSLSSSQQLLMVGGFAVAAASSVAVWLLSMRSGVRVLERMAG